MLPCPPWFLRIRLYITWLEEGLLCLLLGSMVLLACVQILLRDLFSGGFIWSDPALRYLVLWSGLLGAAVATRQGKHIAIDIASHLVPERVFSWLVLIVDLFSTVVCGVLTYAAILFVKGELEFSGGRLLLGLPSWALNLIFPIAFGLITLRFLLMAMETMRSIAKLEPCRPPSSMAKRQIK